MLENQAGNHLGIEERSNFGAENMDSVIKFRDDQWIMPPVSGCNLSGWWCSTFGCHCESAEGVHIDPCYAPLNTQLQGSYLRGEVAPGAKPP